MRSVALANSLLCSNVYTRARHSADLSYFCRSPIQPPARYGAESPEGIHLVKSHVEKLRVQRVTNVQTRAQQQWQQQQQQHQKQKEQSGQKTKEKSPDQRLHSCCHIDEASNLSNLFRCPVQAPISHGAERPKGVYFLIPNVNKLHRRGCMRGRPRHRIKSLKSIRTGLVFE